MGPAFVLRKPGTQVCLEFFKGMINHGAKSNLVTFVHDGTLEPVTVPSQLGRPGCCSHMLNTFDAEIELMLVLLFGAEILRSPIRENPKERNAMFLEEGNNAVIWEIRGNKVSLEVIYLAKATLL